MEFNPKVSIIIPLYNCEKYILQCINSVYDQSYKNIEVICVDNESTDASYGVIKELKLNKYPDLITDTVPNIYPFCWDEGKNRGLELMSGEYCIIMGADDYLDKDFIKSYINIISKSPDKILALQSGIMGVQDGKLLGVTKHSYNGISELKSLLLKSCVINTPTVMYNTKLFGMGLLTAKPELYSGAADYDLYCNLVDNGVFIYPYPDTLGYNYRWHTAQATWSMHKSNIKYDTLIQDYWKQKWI